MSSINPYAKSTILSLAEAISGGDQKSVGPEDSVVAKVNQISTILTQNPGLKYDGDVIQKVLSSSKDIQDDQVQKFRRQLINDSFCHEEQGIAILIPHAFITDSQKAAIMRSLDKGYYDTQSKVLKVKEEELKKLNSDEFWNFIKKKKSMSSSSMKKMGRLPTTGAF